jgi:hypothetical protein
MAGGGIGQSKDLSAGQSRGTSRTGGGLRGRQEHRERHTEPQVASTAWGTGKA